MAIVFGIGYSYLGGAANQDSPLLRTHDNLTLGMGAIWRFYKSKERAGQWY